MRAHLLHRRRIGQLVDLDGNSDALAGLGQVAHVGDAGFVLSDEDDDELGMNPGIA